MRAIALRRLSGMLAPASANALARQNGAVAAWLLKKQAAARAHHGVWRSGERHGA